MDFLEVGATFLGNHMSRREFGVWSNSQVLVLLDISFRRGGAKSQWSLGIQRQHGKDCCVLTPHLPVSFPVAEAYVSGMLFCLGIFLSFYLLTVLLACWENWR